jgi:hypothetical protein
MSGLANKCPRGFKVILRQLWGRPPVRPARRWLRYPSLKLNPAPSLTASAALIVDQPRQASLSALEITVTKSFDGGTANNQPTVSPAAQAHQRQAVGDRCRHWRFLLFVVVASCVSRG